MKIVPVLLLFICVFAASQSSKPADNAQIERGKYLVNEVAKCGSCHTPHLANGKEDPARALQGSHIEVKPLHPVKWEDHAPALAGGPRGSWTQADVSKTLQTGLDRKGGHLDAPMPEYHMHAEDADAIAAYIFSLPRPAHQAQSEQHEHEHHH
ncbi:MAG: c-type cytochrome [Acidobacteriales bacterium]|nr:c-type cytochrome [Terriglobales bacterium]